MAHGPVLSSGDVRGSQRARGYGISTDRFLHRPEPLGLDRRLDLRQPRRPPRPQRSLTGPPKRARGQSQLSRPAERPSYTRGDLLIFPTNQLGPGKLVGTDGGDLVLEYFDAPGRLPEDRLRRAVPRLGLRRFELKPETRVFWESDEGWRSGRTMETTYQRDVYVRSRDWEGFIAEDRLYVRWDRPLVDPVGFAEAHLLESPLLADLRRPFLRAILRQRSAARGMKGALSSAIELHDHQLDTAWRVLQDPIQRHLLTATRSA